MITYTELVNSMTEAYRGGASLQGTIRAFIRENIDKENGHVAEDIASVVTEYRRAIDVLIGGEYLLGAELKSAIKKRDNIINDVSRICREMLGHSIVCTSRKKGEYKAIPALPKERSPKAVVDPSICTHVHFDPTRHCHIPLDVAGLRSIIDTSDSQFAGNLGRHTCIISDISPEGICALANEKGISLEELAKYILTTLKSKGL